MQTLPPPIGFFNLSIRSERCCRELPLERFGRCDLAGGKVRAFILPCCRRACRSKRAVCAQSGRVVVSPMPQSAVKTLGRGSVGPPLRSRDGPWQATSRTHRKLPWDPTLPECTGLAGGPLVLERFFGPSTHRSGGCLAAFFGSPPWALPLADRFPFQNGKTTGRSTLDRDATGRLWGWRSARGFRKWSLMKGLGNYVGPPPFAETPFPGGGRSGGTHTKTSLGGL